MDVSPNALRRDTVQTLREVNDVLKTGPEELFTKAILLSAKAQCLHTLTLLNEKR